MTDEDYMAEEGMHRENFCNNAAQQKLSEAVLECAGHLLTKACEVPTASSSAALGPIPENRTMQPSGTAPKIGKTTLPVVKLHAGDQKKMMRARYSGGALPKSFLC